MIQFKRGTSESWKKLKKPLAAGQPGYDKTKHKIKVGDGEKLWEKLPYASISEEEVLDSEKNAKARLKEDSESLAIMTYGTEDPDKDTVGKLYLQSYDAEPEVDYAVSYGPQGIWQFRKWHSGRASCYGKMQITTSVQNSFDGALFYYSKATTGHIKYPFDFISPPSEVVTVQSPGGFAWLSSIGMNTTSNTADYRIVSPDKQTSERTYVISFQIEGFWK